MLAKITGGVSHVTDGLELAKRFGAAWDSGDWSPVVGQVSKIVGSAAGAASMGLVRTIGLVAAGALGVTGGVALIGTAILGAAVSIGISVVADMVEKEISKSKNFDFGKQLSDQSAQYEDLAVVGNFKSSESLKLSAKNEMTLIGEQHFKNVELDGKDIAVIGNVSADENVSVNGDNIQTYSDEAVKAMLAPQGGNPAEQIPHQPADTQTETANTVNGDEIRAALGLREEQYLDLEYLGRAAAKAGENPTAYALKIYNLAEELVYGQEFYDEYDEEWERITGVIPVPNQPAGLGNDGVYQAEPPPVNSITDDYKMPSI
ncbi:hypothetical protein EGK75_03055 [Neisseria weixii]|uniref:Uncharacterized protein n=1 Tax=Neisseria weixii TaxID=1853276 RepID=A0A3N4N6J9_9NEIS|nr:hypothetical protein [Neisseria weixii]RPD89777.1 hypothetical protein EGK74_03055 [Neisseria weixii]RPD90006.1 hypothetical protein EGK75_03055 [Neisseria weixii]